MEKKTIGNFIAALRKANGLTQKDLAEKLNVSDKTISRWERDEGVPDLALIPVIAEIFHVSCDELLCGERRPTGEQASASVAQKGEKQRQRLLASAMSKYQTKSYIAIGVAGGGLLVAMVCNFGFLRGSLGFFLGAAFFLASVICQLIFLNQAFLSVADDSFAEEESNSFKRSAIKWMGNVCGLNAALLGFCLPMALNEGLAYAGLTAPALFIYGAVLALAALVLYAIGCYFVNASLLEKGVYVLNEKEAAVYHHNYSLKRRCAVGFVVIAVVSLIGHAVATRGWDKWLLAERTSFDDYESFAAYMEQDIPSSRYDMWSVQGEAQIAPDAEIAEEEALTSTLEDEDGNVLVKYIRRNWDVVSIRYSNKNGNYLPILVATQDDIREAEVKIAILNMVFAVVYCVEAIAAFLIYFKKRKK